MVRRVDTNADASAGDPDDWAILPGTPIPSDLTGDGPARDASPGDIVNKSPLATPAWIEFNTTRHRLTAHHVSLSTAEGDRLDAVLYLDRRGRVVMPPNNPYLPLSFETRRTTAASRTAAWVRISRPLLDELLDRGVVNRVQFPPDVADIRPFTWDGFRVNARYTYVLDLPIDPSRMSAGMRKDVRRAERAGTTVERTDDLDAVMACLSHAEQRQRFSHGLTRRDLEAAAASLARTGCACTSPATPTADPRARSSTCTWRAAGRSAG